LQAGYFFINPASIAFGIAPSNLRPLQNSPAFFDFVWQEKF
jgi:hypothetical protein